MQESFFVLGCQRSGTTLLRLILDSHPQIHCFDEYKSYSLLAEPKLLNEELKKFPNKKLIGFKTPGYTEQMNYDKFLDPVQKLEVNNTFKNLKIIFIYRDARDVIASMKKHYKGNKKSWLETQPLKIINFWKEQNLDFISKYKDDLLKLENSQNDPIIAGSIFWKIKNDFISIYQETRQILPLSYESLCLNPTNESKKICKFLDISFDSNMLNHEKILHDEVDNDGIAVGNVNSKNPISNNSIGLYKKNLSDIEISNILEFTKK